MKLLPCPSCEGMDILAELEPEYMRYICMDCNFQAEPAYRIGLEQLDAQTQRARELWNTRPQGEK